MLLSLLYLGNSFSYSFSFFPLNSYESSPFSSTSSTSPSASFSFFCDILTNKQLLSTSMNSFEFHSFIPTGEFFPLNIGRQAHIVEIRAQLEISVRYDSSTDTIKNRRYRTIPQGFSWILVTSISHAQVSSVCKFSRVDGQASHVSRSFFRFSICYWLFCISSDRKHKTTLRFLSFYVFPLFRFLITRPVMKTKQLVEICRLIQNIENTPIRRVPRFSCCYVIRRHPTVNISTIKVS